MNFCDGAFVSSVKAGPTATERGMAKDARGERIRRHLLVLRCQTGDARAFEALYTESGPRTMRYLTAMIGSDAAQDIQQEVWLNVYRSIASLADPSRFTTWLLASARNRAIDWLRRTRREEILLDRNAPDIGEAMRRASAEPVRRSFDDPDVRAAIEHLPTLLREVLMLRYRDELSYAEIGLVAGCPVGTVRSRLHNARRALERILDPANELELDEQERLQ